MFIFYSLPLLHSHLYIRDIPLKKLSCICYTFPFYVFVLCFSLRLQIPWRVNSQEINSILIMNDHIYIYLWLCKGFQSFPSTLFAENFMFNFISPFTIFHFHMIFQISYSFFHWIHRKKYISIFLINNFHLLFKPTIRNYYSQ